MNTEAVVEMIDAITEGRNYNLELAGANETGQCRFQFANESFSLALLEGWATEIDDTRTAREIAGALVAWANRKDGLTYNEITNLIRLELLNRESPEDNV